MKRVIAIALCLVLLVGVLPMGAGAVTQEEEYEICTQLRSLYRQVQYRSGYRNLRGLCGLMTSYQLHILGIDETLQMYNGNQQYDAYKNLALTTGGFRVDAYSAKEYNMEEALATATHNGTRDAYNILLGFQWTNTEAGAYYGHANMVHTIQDGTVFFMEGYNSMFGGPAGTPIVCTIPELVDFYDDWTSLEGVIVFGNKSWLDSCREVAADLFVQAQETTKLLSQPCEVGDNACESLRTVAKGERLRATALYETPDGDWYYQIEDGAALCYVSADAVQLLRMNDEDVRLLDAQMPQQLKKRKDFDLTGKVVSQHNLMNGLHIAVKDMEGNVVQETQLNHESRMYSLNKRQLNRALRFQNLDEGTYTLEIRAELLNHYVEDGILCGEAKSVLLCSEAFGVGVEPEQSLGRDVTPKSHATDAGWIYEGDTWYYYRDGKPCTGWVCESGLDYYLRPDGSVTTGWAKINGKDRYFTATGAMRTGWMEENGETYYLLYNGEKAVSWREIDGVRYCFDENGRMLRSTCVSTDEGWYVIADDGSAQLQTGDSPDALLSQTALGD